VITFTTENRTTFGHLQSRTRGRISTNQRLYRAAILPVLHLIA
jgi:hypothetical protein